MMSEHEKLLYCKSVNTGEKRWFIAFEENGCWWVKSPFGDCSMVSEREWDVLAIRDLPEK